MRVGRALIAGAMPCVLACVVYAPVAGADEAISLTEAVRQTLHSSLDLAAQRAQLDANREEIGITRSALLPQVEAGLQGQILDDDRPDDTRGNVTEKSATVFAGVSQVLYDEGAWAGYSIQKHLYSSQEEQLETFRLGLIASAASTFIELELAEKILEIQRQNREVTLKNIETAKARVATGYSGERDVLRWQSQLSANDAAVVQAETLALVNRFELNRVRNRPREQSIRLIETRLADYGFAYARAPIARAIQASDKGRALRDFMVRVGLSRSPTLASIDAAILAERRQLKADHRAFWVPTLSLGAGVNHLAAQESASGQSTSNNDTEWGVRAGLTFPVFEGGAKLGELRQTRASLSSLRTQRRSARQSVEESVRTAFAQSSGSYVGLGFARTQVESAQRNFDLVDQSYVSGVTSILDLLDAQSQLLEAQIGVANAYYGFLQDLVAAEQAISLFAFLEPEAEVSALLDQLEAGL